MIYGPYMKTFHGDKNRINNEYYWFIKKDNSRHLRFWHGKKLWKSREILNKQAKKRYKEDENVRIRAREYAINYRLANPESVAKYQRKYKNDKENKKKNKIYQLGWQKNKYKTDIIFKLKKRLRDRFYACIKNKTSGLVFEYSCATVEEIYNHLESQFTDGINWENFGGTDHERQSWQIDHRRPCASFDLNNEDEIYMCFHWSNLQPLWHMDNIQKSDKYDQETFEYEWKGREIGWVKKN